MKMKKFLLVIMVMFLTIIISNQSLAVEYREIDHIDRYDIITKAFSEWMDSFKSEDTSEDRRILAYEIGAVGISESNKNKIRSTIEFRVTPFSKQNTKWNYTEEPVTKLIKGEEFKTYYNDNICFLEMTKVNGEYQVEYIAQTPKGYDEFLARFEEYKAGLPDRVTTDVITGQKVDYNSANQEIEKMSHGIVMVCFTVFLTMIFVVIIRFVKKPKLK